MTTATNEKLRTTNGGATTQWTVAEATEHYDVARWGQGYFSVSDTGHVLVHPTKEPARSVDLKKLVDRLELRGMSAPILIRFPDILKHRLGEIHGAFQQAMAQFQYKGKYVCVYPIKVNQQRQVVEEVMEFGQPVRLRARGRLQARAAGRGGDGHATTRRSSATASRTPSSSRWRCWPRRSGATSFPSSRSTPSSSCILKYAAKVGVRPQIGMRVKLAARGMGRWQSSGGYRSKFGLTVTEILRGLELLKSHGMQDCFKLLHFHLGSQITNIRIIKNALNEAARIYCDLAKAGAGVAVPRRRAAGWAWTTTARRPTSSRA